MKGNIFRALMIGLTVSQLLATFHVWQSDLDLHQSLAAIRAAGYLTVPNEHIMPSLKHIMPAFCGGLFFTLSIGMALSLIPAGAIWVWQKISYRNIRLLIAIGICWMSMIAFVNFRGFCPIGTTFFIFIPASVIVSMRHCLSEQCDTAISRQPRKFNRTLVHVLLIMIVVSIGISLMNIRVFLNFRDKMLLSNSAGLQINNFYYKYTLYAAEVFRSPAQKLLRTCRLSFEDRELKERIETLLLQYNYLSIDADIPVDLEMTRKDAEEFLRMTRKDAREFLKKYSQSHDRHVFFRSCVLVSLFGLPFLMLYTCIYGLYFLIRMTFQRYPRAAGIAVAFLLISISAAVLYQNSRSEMPTDLNHALISDNSEERLSALKIIVAQKIDIADFDVSKIIQSPHILERYWLVRAFGQSNSLKIFDNMIRLLDDPQFNVAYTMYAVLGNKKNPRAVSEILKRIRVSDNWYVQGYAYTALRRSGWIQSRYAESDGNNLFKH